MPKKIYPEGIIKTSPKGHKFIRVNGKWKYIKKPKEEWNSNSKKISEENIKKIRGLFMNGKSYDQIAKITNCSKDRIIKCCMDLQVKYPPVKIPENMKETQYPGYYITKDGKSYRKPGKYDRNGQHGKINEYGLIYLTPGYRGHPKYPEYHYECINISIRDENGKYLKQIKKCIHQLVAEVFVENPEGYIEIDHIDRNNKNNHYKNLRWVSRKQNMENTTNNKKNFP